MSKNIFQNFTYVPPVVEKHCGAVRTILTQHCSRLLLKRLNFKK